MEGLPDDPAARLGQGRWRVLTARRVVFWRHGRTSWNIARRFQGQTDIPLDEVGIAQAASAARLLTGLSPTAIVVSDLERARDTAAPLAELTGLTPVVDARLRETYAGHWEGLHWPELEARYGDEAARWSADPAMPAGEIGETRLEVADRVCAAVEDALADLADGGTLVVVTHGGAARAGIGRMLGIPAEHWDVLGVLSNCAWSVLVANPGGHGSAWRLQEYNAGSLPVPALADDR